MEIISVLVFVPFLVSVIDFSAFLITGKRKAPIFIIRICEPATYLCLPFLYVTQDLENNCCGESAAFSPEHQVTIWVIITICLVAYFYSSYRKSIATPIVEILINAFLMGGIILNIFIAIQAIESFFIVLGNLPIVLFATLALAKNQQLFIEQSKEMQVNTKNRFELLAWKILNLKPLLKYPALFVLCLPLLVIISAVLLLVGQKPDAIIRAFTETYKHGFSQWDYKCDNVACGGHYLCSVAAKGHPQIVKPVRRGIRKGKDIICNRQLLISNAFEDLLREKLPRVHKATRKQYNKVGYIVHRYYSVFDNKYFSDCIYILMKPLEWFFLLMLYAFDRKPENRICKQYISKRHRLLIDAH